MEEENRIRVVKVTMPIRYADEFITESKIMFNDSRWVHMMFKSKMYDAMYSLLADNEKKEIQKVKKEILNDMDSYYEGLNKLYKEFYDKNKKRF